MIDHLELFVRDIEVSTAFYRGALAPLDYQLHVNGPARGFGASADKLDFWIRPGEASTPRPHYAFHCATRELVDSAHAAALRSGAVNDRSPALMPQVHEHYYAGLVFDPDGHKVEFACHKG